MTTRLDTDILGVKLEKRFPVSKTVEPSLT